MDHPPPRTNTTFLTDDDLLIYDVLTRGRIPLSALRQVDYRFHMNCGYTHSLEDAELVDRIQTLAQLRLLTYRRSRRHRRRRPQKLPSGRAPFTFPFPKAHVSFNVTGGEMWDQERNLAWHRRIWQMPADESTLAVAALSKAVIDDYLLVSHSTGRFQLQRPPTFRHHEERSLSVFYTERPFFNVFTATVPCVYPSHNEIHRVWDTVTYREQRTWWQEVNDPLASKLGGRADESA